MKNNRYNHPQITAAKAEPRAQEPLLTQEEEKELSIRIQNGHRAVERLKNETNLTAETQAELRRTADDGHEARNTLVMRNMGLAHSFANQLFPHNSDWIQENRDYSQDALESLIRAADTFLWQKGYRFSTYASICIQNDRHRKNALFGSAIRQPEGQMKAIAQYKRLRHQECSIDKAAALMGISLQTAFLYEQFLSGASLQDPVSEEEGACELGEMIADPNATTSEDIDAYIDMCILWLQVEDALLQLPLEQQRLLILRYGLFGEEAHKYQELVGICGKTPSSIQKKEKAAIAALRKTLRGSGYTDLPLAA